MRGLAQRTGGRLVLVCAVAGLAAGAASARTDSPEATGVTPATIVLGGTFPLTGEASAAAGIARGARAYFRYVNAHGGVFHRRIDFRFRDDGFSAAAAVTATQRLVTQDGAFAIFGSYGTDENLATRPMLNRLGVPQLFVTTGATDLAGPAFPWTLGYPPTFAFEGGLLARTLLRAQKAPRIGVLYEDDPFGRGLLSGLRKGLGARASAIVAAEPYDPTVPDVREQVQALKAARATAFVNFAFGRYAIDAYVVAKQLGWDPARTYISSAAGNAATMKVAAATAGRRAVDGTVSILYAKDPGSQTIAADKGFQLFKRILVAYDRSVRTNDAFAMYGMAIAYTMVDVLRRAGRNLTRGAALRAAAAIDEKANPFLLPGMVVRTTARDRLPLQQAMLQRWQNGRWVQYGDLVGS